MYEQSKAAKRRYRDGDFLCRYFVGDGIDVGAGPDTLGRYLPLFPALRSVRGWDLPDGDAQLLAGVADGSFDFLHSSHCLEHMRDPAEALANWIRVVKPNGYLVVSVPDEDMYEQGVFPSRFNPDHKWTFTIHKDAGMSWSPRSVNVLDLVTKMSGAVEVERIQLVREFFDNRMADQDQTLQPNAECAIEIVLRKRLGTAPRQATATPEAAGTGTGTGTGTGARVPSSNGSSQLGRFDAPLGREALALLEGGHRDASERKALEALLKEPNDCVAMDVLERLYLDSARYAQCADILERLLTHTPDNPAAWNNLGCCYGELRRFPQARAAFENAVRADPAYLTAYGGLAAMRYSMGDAAGAEAAYREVLSRSPEHFDSRVNIANCLIAMEKADAAQAFVDEACTKLLPDLTKPADVSLAAPGQGLNAPYRSRIENRPIFESMHARLGMALLALGRTTEGLRLLEWRLGSAFVPGFDARRAKRMWRGEPLRGKRLLLLWEQGYGDVFQGLRHVRRLAAMADCVLLPADASVRALFETSFADLGEKIVICDWREEPAAFDYYVSILSLHHRVNELGVAQPEAVGAYLSCDADTVARFRSHRLAENALAVGIVYAGKPEMLLDGQRSLAEPIVRTLTAPLPGVRFYSLQVGPRANDCAALAVANGVVDWSVMLDSFAATAAAMKALDVVICVDTASVHLAGALGMPAILLNRFGSEYRWQLLRDDGVWYASVEQVRQKTLNDWSGAVAEARERLAQHSVSRGCDARVPGETLAPTERGRADALERLKAIELALGASKLDEARPLIDAYLLDHPDSTKALCHAGALELLSANAAAARGYLDRAIELRPDYAVAYSNRAAARAEDDPAREDDMVRAVACDPAFHTGWANLARLRRQKGNTAQAFEHACRAAQLAPTQPDIVLLSAEIALDAGEFEASLRRFEWLRDQHPELPESHANLIPAHAALERRDDAQADLDKALELDPTHAGALNNGIQFYLRTQQYDKALALARRYVEAHSELAGSHVMLGLVYHHLKSYEPAEAALKRALDIEPEHMEALFALGTVLERVDRLGESEEALRRALTIRRDYRVLVNLAVTMNRQQRYDEARRLNSEALAASGEKMKKELQPRMATVRQTMATQPFRAELQTIDLGFGPDWNNALISLAEGDYASGFAGYEVRQEHQTVSGMTGDEYRTLLWRGEPLDGKRILLLPEQGYGDVIQFLRYLPELKRRGATVLVGASAPLARLLEITPGVDQTVPLDDSRRPPFDYLCPLMSLAHRLGVSTTADLRPAFPYLRAPEGARAAWRERFPAMTGLRRIGVVWAGRKIYPADRLRSIPLAEMRGALAQVPGILWVSLQVGDCAPEAEDWPGMVDVSDELVDFAETAALVEQLDLVITVDTAVAHLAAALGKPVWMLNRISTDWRWGARAATTGWYPSMRIFRQKLHLSWVEPLEELAQALTSWRRDEHVAIPADVSTDVR
ncbi:tetratricopeptide repeat protein [Trinickia fusca]|uniref:Tetratricopeptide repeat protein n=1 Tax=Trinickia fusca TaxID=2419777 RepID=A0A494X8K2_9BURK|nr:tetratricopeptide repeat protein [Trinickia fusca]RKP46878.1 tetratricopeptide repeat protein [Trinickia fusca]